METHNFVGWLAFVTLAIVLAIGIYQWMKVKRSERKAGQEPGNAGAAAAFGNAGTGQPAAKLSAPHRAVARVSIFSDILFWQFSVTTIESARHGDLSPTASHQPDPRQGTTARRRHRQRVRRPRGGGAARRAGLPGHGAGAAGRARRPGLRPPAGRLHLRRRPDDRHRALPARGAVAALRPAPRRRRRAAAGLALLPHPLPRRRHVRLLGRSRGDAGRGGAALAGRRRGLRALHAR